MRRTVSFGAIVGVMLMCSALTHAVDVDVKFTGNTLYEQVVVSHSYVGDSPFRAGVYNIMIDTGVPGEDPTRYESFCIDLKQDVSGEYHPYGVAFVDQAPLDGGSAWTPMGTSKANDVRELWHEHIAEVSDSTTAAAFQVALWEIIYENTTAAPDVDAYNVASGDFLLIGNSPQAVIDQANAWLGTVKDGNAVLDDKIDLRALTHYSSETNWQDYLYDINPGGEVPEPVTMASVLLAVCGLGTYIRRRSAA